MAKDVLHEYSLHAETGVRLIDADRAALAMWVANHGGAVASHAVSWSTTPSVPKLTKKGDPSVWEAECPKSATVSFTAVSACGASSVTTATFTIHDTVSPLLMFDAQDYFFDADGATDAEINAAYDAWYSDRGGARCSKIADGCKDVWSAFPRYVAQWLSLTPDTLPPVKSCSVCC